MENNNNNIKPLLETNTAVNVKPQLEIDNKVYPPLDGGASKCINCNNEINGNYNFCPNCGVPLKKEANSLNNNNNIKIIMETNNYNNISQTPELKCRVCNRTINSLSSICPYCGASIKDSLRLEKEKEEILNTIAEDNEKENEVIYNTSSEDSKRGSTNPLLAIIEGFFKAILILVVFFVIAIGLCIVTISTL